MKRKRTNRTKWRRGTAMFLAMLLVLQVFTGNIAGVRALEFSSGEEQAADSGYDVSDNDSAEEADQGENDQVDAQEVDAADSADEQDQGSDVEKSADTKDGQKENSDTADAAASDNGNNSSVSGDKTEDSTSENGNDNQVSESEKETEASETEESGASDGTNAEESSAADSSNAGNEAGSAGESGSASETSAAGEESSAEESSAAETGAAESTAESSAEESTAETIIESSSAAAEAKKLALYEAYDLPTDGNTFDMSTEAGSLWLYTNLQYKQGSTGNVDTGTGNGYILTGSSNNNIYIGNGTASDDGELVGDADINVYLNDLHLTGTSQMVINPVGEIKDESGASYAVNMDVAVQSEIEELVLANNAKLNINLTDGGAGLEVGAIKLGKGSVLTVHAGDGIPTETVAEAGDSTEEDEIAKAAAQNDGGKFTVTGNFTGDGAVILTGEGKGQVIVKKGIQADSISLNGVEIDTGKATSKPDLEVKSSLTIKDSAISNVNLLGYAKETTGKKEVTFAGDNTLDKVTAVGTTSDGKAILTINGIDDAIGTVTETTLYQDYPLQYVYKDADGNDGTTQAGWPVYYRTSRNGIGDSAKETVVGSHSASTEASDDETEPVYSYASGTVTLPEITVEGYQYVGWTLSDDASETVEAVKTLSGNHTGELTLSLELESDPVTVILDRNYKPNKDTNDDYETLTQTIEYKDKKLGEKIELGAAPYRFGYEFKGWKVTTGSQETELTSDATEYEIQLKDTDTAETESTSLLSGLLHMLEGKSTNQRTVRLEAQWIPKEYEFRLFVDGTVAKDNIRVINGEAKETLDVYANSKGNLTWDAKDSMYIFKDRIAYGENLGEYLQAELGETALPQLEDQRTGADKVDFSGWLTPGNNMITDLSSLTFTLGSLLDNRPEGKLLSDYDTTITTTPLYLRTQWGTASYTITTDIVSGWDLLVDGEVQKPSALTKMRNALTQSSKMSVKVKQGSSVSWRCKANANANFSLWNFSTSVEDTSFEPEEGQYSSGAQYLYFTAMMPAANVTAEYSSDLSKLYIDINQSSITFEEDVQLLSGRTTDGFWYDIPMNSTDYRASDSTILNVNGMSPLFQADSNYPNHLNQYFYEWNLTDAFRITSMGDGTTNPLTLTNTMDLYVKDCKLEANQNYKGTVKNRKVGSSVIEAVDANTIQNNIKSFAEYGNIIQDITAHIKYDVNIHVEGSENKLGVITQSAFYSPRGYESTFRITGTSKSVDKAVISGIFADAILRFQNVKIQEDDEASSEYIIFVNGKNESQCKIYFTNCEVAAPNKRIYTYRGTVTLTDTKMTIGSGRTYGSTDVYGSSYIRCKANWLGGYNTFSIYDSSSVVVDGNVLSTYSHPTSGAIVNTKGFYIVKGNRADLENFILRAGTVITNAAVIGRSCSITGGKLITNQIMNSPSKYPAKDSEGYYTLTGDSYWAKEANSNGDDYPFLTYAATEVEAGVYAIDNNAVVGLLGYYQLSDNSYDINVIGTSDSNPIHSFIEAAIDANGDVKTTVNLPDVESAVKDSSYKTSECFVLGNTTYDTTSIMRSVRIGGNAKIYAAGNITFYNDTTISGGEIYCGGTLSSKRDLTINAPANITAQEVGNSYNLYEEDSDGFKRWEKTVITGGTINADQIGSLTKAHGNKAGSDWSRSTLEISGNPRITSLSNEAEKRTSYTVDTYINYVYGDPLKNPDGNPDNVRHHGENFEGLTADGDTNIQDPTSTDSSVTAGWVLDSLGGPNVDKIQRNAVLAYGDQEIEGTNAYINRDFILFYAVKNRYDIEVKVGNDQIGSITANGNEYHDFSNPIAVTRRDEVQVVLNGTGMKDKTVLWFTDAAGMIHNVKPTITTMSGKTTFTFNMPAGNVDIYVTNEMNLYLNRTEITLMQDGFRTRYDLEGADTDDFSFNYLGDIVVTQDNISGTAANSYYVAAVDEKGSLQGLGVGVTNNRLHITGWNEERNVTLQKVLMNGGLDEDSIIIEQNCGDVKLQINGAVRLLSTRLNSGSTLTFEGKRDAENTQAAVHFYAGLAGTKHSTGFVHNDTGKTGNITFLDLNILRTYNSNVAERSRRRLVYSAEKADKAVFENCTLRMNLYNDMGIVYNFTDVVLKNCDTKFTVADGYTPVMFDGCNNVKIDGGQFDAVWSSPYTSYPPYYNTKTFEITNGAVVTWRESLSNSRWVYLSNSDSRYIPETFTVKNGASFSMDHRIKLKTLQLKADKDSGAPSVTVGQKSGDHYNGYLLCKNIQVEKGTLNTGGLLISGYYDAQNIDQDYKSESGIVKMLQSEKHITTSGVLNITGGSVNASEFVGGARGGTINVENGKLTSPAIGTLDKLYGYGQNIPNSSSGKWIYSYATIPQINQKLTVNLSDNGTIEVQGGQNGTEGYLGGMNSVVNMTGGTLTIDDNAVVGMSAAHAETLKNSYSSKGQDIADHKADNCTVKISGGAVAKSNTSGSISAPYGTVAISGTDTTVDVKDLKAERGDVTITQANGDTNGFKNPHNGQETNKKYKVGIMVSDLLTAENVSISEGAQVYAENAYAVVNGNQGKLSVPVGSGAGLYSKAYGEKGISRADADKDYNDKTNDSEQTVFGIHMVSITYVLNPENVILPEDVSTIVNENPESYVKDDYASNDHKIPIKDAACRGYYFEGWFTDQSLTKPSGENFDTTISNDLTLYAKWKKIPVKFAVRIKISDDRNDGLPKSEFNGIDTWEMSSDGQYFVSKVTPVIEYGKLLLGSAGVNLINYNTVTMNVTDVRISDSVTAYQGTKNVDGQTLVTKDLAEAYRTISKDGTDENAVIMLDMVQSAKRRAVITFDLNKTDGKPSDAKFANFAEQKVQEALGVEESLAASTKFADKTVTGTKSDGLIRPTATGYTFIGWNTDKSAKETTSTGWVTSANVFPTETTVYAIWKANTYLVEFKGDSAGERVWVTEQKDEPDASAATVTSLRYYWLYDTPVTEGKFYPANAGQQTPVKNLPYAWKEGFVFDNADGWTYTTDGSRKALGQTTILNKNVIGALDAEVGDPNGNPTEVALTLEADYTPVRVRYHLNGGKFTSLFDGAGMDSVENPVPVDTPTYGTALRGYTRTSNIPTGGESKASVTATYTDGSSVTYQVISTTAEHYNTEKNYVDFDYRHTLSKKGYTFEGWYTRTEGTSENGEAQNEEDQVGTTPRFQDVDVYAKWTANSYKLTMYSHDTSDDREYLYTSFNSGNPDSPIKEINVTVGEEIQAAEGSKWPSRNGDWYAYNKDTTADENNKRFFLGATFAALDPGDTRESVNDGYQIYQNYAKAVTKLQNSDTLFQTQTTVAGTGGTSNIEGTIFQLPEDTVYRSAIEDSYANAAGFTIPDYPDGCEISMYAVYRERSLVFVERYIDVNGQEQENVKFSCAWNQYSNYPDTYGTKGVKEITDLGYSLVGWFVNGKTPSATPYPKTEADYKDQMDGFKTAAASLGTYDIMVYTFYAAQVVKSVTLTASSSPIADDQAVTSVYRLPASMDTGVLSIKLLEAVKNLNLVSKDDMESHAYASSWTKNGVTYDADNTAAIVVTLKTGNKTVSIDLSEVTAETDKSFELNAGANSEVTLTMYHSRVMTKESEYSVNLQFLFSRGDDNELKEQWIKEMITVKLVPSLYDVTYQVKLPESKSELITVGNAWNGYDEPTNPTAEVTEKKVKLAYGSSLTDELPEFEGYTKKEKWISGDKEYNTLTVPVDAKNNGNIVLTRGYTANKYKLSAEADVLQYWNITYTNGAADTADPANKLSGTAEQEVMYHSVVKFSPIAGTDGKTDPPQFVTLTITNPDGTTEKTVVKLPAYGKEDGDTYTFAMPARTVHASRVCVQTLYLDYGTISITESGYTQNKADGDVTEIWPGDYVILQCEDNNLDSHSTTNVLKLADDLRERTIQLGNLYITNQDSIALAEGAKADLTVNYGDHASWINAKNILAAGKDTKLKLSTGLEGSKAAISLEPDAASAAIGGNAKTPEIGTIEIEDLDITMTLQAGSSASGIGAGSEAGTGSVTVKNSAVNVVEESSTTVYSGAWIGGTNISSVTIDYTEISRAGEKNMAGPRITDGADVTITDSTIGSSKSPVYDPVYAGDKLTITGSKIYQLIMDDLKSNQSSGATAPIGTKDGVTTISGSTIQTDYSNGDKSDYYTGKLLIEDAESDVYIWGTQIVELGNGSVEIEEKKVTQGTESHKQNRSMDYLLLEEKGTDGSDSNVTIESLGNGSKVTVRNPYGTNAANGEVTIKDLSVNADATIVLEGNLTVDGKAELGSGKKLMVDANAVDNTAEQNPYGITLKDTSTGTDAAFAGGASYTQEGGKFTSAGDLGNKEGSGLDVKLTNVTTNVSNLYAKDLTISGGSTKAGTNGTTGEIGSKPALGADGTAAPTTVTLKDGVSVTAKTIGALGDQNKTFTFVTAKTTDTKKLGIHGDLVQDLYRLEYDTVTSDLTTDSLDTVVRTSADMNGDSVDAAAITNASTTICPNGGVPGDPTFNGGNVSDVFTCWYIWRKPSGSETEAQRVGLASGKIPPEGMTDVTTLASATPGTVKDGEYYLTENEDGTSTLRVHAWLKATGIATVKEGRRFESFDGADTTVTICENHAFTAQLVSTGTAISNRDYALTFNSVLPVGTDLTLTVAGNPKSYYYYTVTDKDVTDVKKNFFFSEFKAMGSESAPVFTANASAANETFLVAVDFADAASRTSLDDLEMQFKLLPSKIDQTSMLNLGTQLTCGFTKVQLGQLTAVDASVQVAQAPAGDSALVGKTLYLAAKVTKRNSTSGSADSLIPYGVKAELLIDDETNAVDGTWISRDTILFEAGTYNTDGNGVSTAKRTVSFEGLDAGTYDVQWTLVYGAGSGNDLYNLLGNTLSDPADGTYTVAAKADPYLAVTADEAGRTIAQGIEKKVGFNWKSTASAVKVTVEKQGLLGDFEKVSGSAVAGFTIVQPEFSASDGQMAAGTAAVTFSNNVKAGTYRIVFSMDDESREDNVYFVFIVEDNK